MWNRKLKKDSNILTLDSIEANLKKEKNKQKERDLSLELSKELAIVWFESIDKNKKTIINEIEELICEMVKIEWGPFATVDFNSEKKIIIASDWDSKKINLITGNLI